MFVNCTNTERKHACLPSLYFHQCLLIFFKSNVVRLTIKKYSILMTIQKFQGICISHCNWHDDSLVNLCCFERSEARARRAKLFEYGVHWQM